MVPPASHRVSRVRWYSGYCRLARNFAYGIFTLSDLPSQIVRLFLTNTFRSPQPQRHCCLWFGLFPFRSPLLWKSNFFLFLRLLRCFSSAGVPPYTYFIQCTVIGYCPTGLPHSEICGSQDICSSPQLIAACHVLRRLLMPRHPPCTLYSLISHVSSLKRYIPITLSIRKT